MPDMRRSVKDSAFTYLFKRLEYTRQLYLTLHPEDTDVTEQDCKLVTLENILSTGLYNDLGIQVRDKLLLLVEGQSTFSENLVLRMLWYLAATYKKYVEEHKLDLYTGRVVSIPRPELSLNQDSVVQMLASKFSLPPQMAEATVKEYWTQ